MASGETPPKYPLVWLVQRCTIACGRHTSVELQYLRVDIYGPFRQILRVFGGIPPLYVASANLG